MKPKKLQLGDTIAILAPSSGLGGLFPHRVDNGIKALEGLGFKVKVFPTAKKFYQGNAGTPEERVKDLHDAFSDPAIRAIICTIGGASANALLPLLDYELIKKNKKIFCGYSDITILHYALLKKTDLTTFYGPCLMTQFGEYPKPFPYTIEHFKKALTTSTPIGKIIPSETWTDDTSGDWAKKLDLKGPRTTSPNKDAHLWLQAGKANGKIVGGCLPSILQLKGTSFDIDYKDKILFIETPEGENFSKGRPLSNIDSQLMDLRLAGIFEKIRGFIIGRGFGYTPEEREHLKQIITNHTKTYTFPVLYNVNIGHIDPIITLPLNIEVSLDSHNNLFSINENGVEES